VHVCQGGADTWSQREQAGPLAVSAMMVQWLKRVTGLSKALGRTPGTQERPVPTHPDKASGPQMAPDGEPDGLVFPNAGIVLTDWSRHERGGGTHT
jgi:hypothetical protein